MVVEEWRVLGGSILGFLSENWGNLASAFGAILTVYYSHSASRSARLAKEAANETRSQIKSFDLLSELSRIDGRVSDLLARVEAKDWALAADRAQEIYQSISTAISASSAFLSPETIEKLTSSIAQFRLISSATDRARAPQKAPSDTSRQRRIIVEQQLVIRHAIVEVKRKIGA